MHLGGKSFSCCSCLAEDHFHFSAKVRLAHQYARRCPTKYLIEAAKMEGTSQKDLTSAHWPGETIGAMSARVRCTIR